MTTQSKFEDWWTAHADEPKRKQRKQLRKRVRQLEAETETLRDRLKAARKQAETQRQRLEEEMFAMLDYLDSPAQAAVQRATVIGRPSSDVHRIEVTTVGDAFPRYLDGVKSATVTMKLVPEDVHCDLGGPVGVKLPEHGFKMTRGLISRRGDEITVYADGPFRDEPVKVPA